MPRLHVVLLLYIITGHSSHEIFSETNVSEGSGSEEITIPTNADQFFRNSFKCCHHTSTYSSAKRVCVYSSESGNSRWKKSWDPIDPERVHRTPDCGLENVLVDYELVVKVETSSNRSGELNDLETGCETEECRSERIKRTVSLDVETFPIDLNGTDTEDRIGRLLVLTAEVVSGGSLEGFANGPGILTLYPNGTLNLGGETFAREEFCVDGRDGHGDTYLLTLRVCEASVGWCLPERACVRKCCPDGESMLVREVEDNGELKKKRKCAPSTLGFQVQKELPPNMQLGVYNGDPCGSRKKYALRPEVYEDDAWQLLPNGSLSIPHIPPSYFPHTEYCLERVYDPKGEMDGLYAYLCFPEVSPEPEPYPDVVQVAYPLALLISCFFLVATLVVYALIPSLRNLHGLTLISHASCLLAAFICLTTVRWTNVLRRETIECKVLGFSILFTFTAALSWLNVMCFDIWWTFGGFRGRGGVRACQRGKPGKRNGLKVNLKKYLYYSIYAWMVPYSITAFTLVADLYGKDFLPYAPPGIGLLKCWFADDGEIAVLIHFVAPSTILLIADVVMFILTALRCSKVKAEIQKMQSIDKEDIKKNGENPKFFGKRWWKKKYQRDKEKMLVNLKLCSAMGINWSLEMASWWLSRGEDYNSQRILPLSTWYIPDLANCLHGVFIFFVFVFKKRTLRQLWSKCKELCGCCAALPRQTTRNSRNSSMQDSANTSTSVHVAPSCNVEKKYDFNDGQEVEISCWRRWLNICRFKKTQSNRHNRFKNRCLSQTSTTSINVSEDANEAGVSLTP